MMAQLEMLAEPVRGVTQPWWYETRDNKGTPDGWYLFAPGGVILARVFQRRLGELAGKWVAQLTVATAEGGRTFPLQPPERVEESREKAQRRAMIMTGLV